MGKDKAHALVGAMGSPEADDPALREVLDGISDAERANGDPFDKAVLTLSSGALALSFTFVKDLVKPAIAKYNWLLYCSWSSFVLALIATATAYVIALHDLDKQWYLAFDVFRHRRASMDNLQELARRQRKTILRFSIWQGGLFILGIILFSVYVMLNFNSEVSVNGATNHTEERAAKPSGYIPAPKPSPAARGAGTPAVPASQPANASPSGKKPG